MKAGYDYPGVGVGAMVFNQEGKVFLAKRGPRAWNEQGTWEFPGGKVSFKETLAHAIVREFEEEYGMTIELIDLLGVNDHILEAEHWVSPTFIARFVGGTPTILEPEKCSEIGWFALSSLPEPLSVVTQEDVRIYRAKYGEKSVR
ncbi:MAG TPA: NUDIX domain-containing protein [Ktedonobacteraceae bacterium]|jgi:8-oxo-dGTP diphosphatase|nr:NUDIX domain-containing protein [Ktedonobacteraceae bacterium]